MRILITNDDGILAPGIEALYQAVSDLGHVDVVAPDDSQSAIGHAISVLKPLLVRRVHVNNVFHGWSVAGRPADCVKLALIELLDERPDVVLSGINAGANAGINVLYSGTIAGAMEGALMGVPSVAFSLTLSDELDFRKAGRVARMMLEPFIAARPEPGACLSINIPPLDKGWPRGVRCCPQSPTNWEEHYEKRVDQDGHAIYWLDGSLPDHDASSETDLAAIREGYVAVTPLRANLTHWKKLGPIAEWNWPASFGQGDRTSAAD
ncbi:MAG: 5'/3'-nucleotidase SurE [Phycisphaerae bacterium]|nr:5'/3'-nucleotidase SurE [Phycisphaerae bacterium]